MSVHEEERPVDEGLVARLLAVQAPELAGREIVRIGAGTDNTMFRLGTDLVMRLPRTPETSVALSKELRWLPHLAPRLTLEVPTPVVAGVPSSAFDLPWAVYRWIDGDAVSTDADSSDALIDWTAYGRDLATFVAELHRVPLPDDAKRSDLSWYRGGPLLPHDAWVRECLGKVGALDPSLDVDTLLRCWTEGLALAPSTAAPVWLHGDLKPSNVLVRAGRLAAIIDFGGLSVGLPDAEHAPVWDLPPAARAAYRAVLDLDEPTWLRARAWAVMVGAAGAPHYWHTLPDFAAECVARLRTVAADAGPARM